MLISREFTFDAAHHLVDYHGKCERLHGHTWKIRVTLSCPVKEDGLAFDFLALKATVEEKVIDVLDHSDLNDTLSQPTTENLAEWVWKRLAPLLPLRDIRVYESPSSFVTYHGPDQEAGNAG